MNYLIVPSLQGVKRLFVLSFKTNTSRTEFAGYYLPTVEIKNYNVMIIGQNVLDQQVKNDPRTYRNIQKTTNSN